jgi:hypothetical protein
MKNSIITKHERHFSTKENHLFGEMTNNISNAIEMRHAALKYNPYCNEEDELDLVFVLSSN